jgi:hypothetical protein
MNIFKDLSPLFYIWQQIRFISIKIKNFLKNNVVNKFYKNGGRKIFKLFSYMANVYYWTFWVSTGMAQCLHKARPQNMVHYICDPLNVSPLHQWSTVLHSQ